MERFDQTHSYKLIYVFSMPYETHKGLLKVGEATLTTDIMPNNLVPNCHDLNQAAKKRIDSYTKTASMSYKLEYTELAIKQDSGYTFPFKDKDVHSVLMNSGVHKVQPNGSTGEEWFATNLDMVKAAIKCVKEGKSSISSGSVVKETPYTPIDFREEQKDAVEKTLKAFKKDNEMLWYAKMRFGKTLTALEVIRRSQYRRVIIVTHRPVVDDGWSEDFRKIFYPGHSEHDYHYERKSKDSTYTFDEKTDSENDLKIRKLDKDGTFFVYFASIQDLRGSQIVGGNFNKNNAVFALDWDLIVIDEAHEGTQTELGDNVIKTLRKDHTKVLALSGTPFNLLNQFSKDNVYTWDYVMEQKKKTEWDLTHHGDHNPYADLPKMHIFTYDLGEKLKKYLSDEYDTKAFNFREFFRVWYKGPNSKRDLPKGAVEGKFVHENDVIAFLDMMVKEDSESGYPFSTQEYRDMFRHTLWMVSGVKEAKALSELLRNHPVFKNFGIANVAGEGDKYEEEHSKDALDLVRNTIKNNKYSITLSCGKLTTGVTVKEWTAVLMLSGSYSTAAAQYMQTIFRVQSAGTIEGKQKTDCYVFDFAPDRTLKVLTETVHLSRKPGKSQKKRREAMTEFLNYCPVISISGSKTRKYSVESMMEQIKQIYAERAVNSGFEDESLYNDDLLKLDEIDASKFNELKDIIGASKASKKKKEVVVNGQGLTDEQVEHIDDPEPPATPDTLTSEEIAERQKKKQAKEARKKAIDILRGISIRMPLMIYGADVPIEEDIDIDRFVDIVDEESWKEFMPAGVTKQIFTEFTKYYDRDVFIAAGKRIRKLAASADRETPTRRVIQIAEIFRHFKNPDKETVLTPWRVVNMHMSDTIGGWCFFNEKFEDDTQEEKHRLEEPRFVDRGEVTYTVFGEDAHILEINSKTGLYPLYVAYSSYKQKMKGMSDDDWEPEECQLFWNETIQNNVFVICKTPMAKSITRRTLCGYSDAIVNAHYFDDLVNMLKNKPEQFKKRVLKGSYWKKDVKEMKFDAVVGNPPYQEETATQQSSTNGQAPRKNIFHFFQIGADELSSGATSLIYPGARWIHRFGKGVGMSQFGLNQINDVHLEKLDFYADANDIFKDVAIADGITIVYKNKKKTTPQFDYVYHKNGETITITMESPGEELISLNPQDGSVVKKVVDFVMKKEIDFIHDRVFPRDLFSIESNYVENNPTKVKLLTPESEIDLTREIKLFTNDKAGKAGRSTWYIADRDVIETNQQYIDEWQVVVSSANAGGQKRDNQIEIIDNHSAFGRSRVALGSFKTEKEAQNFFNYCRTVLIRFMFLMTDESLTSLGKKVPDILDYTDDNGILDFSKDLNKQLYKLVGLSDSEIAYIESVVKAKDTPSIYESLLKTSYTDTVKYFLKKYGVAKHNYFKDTNCTTKNPQVTRTSEGLYCHHIDEDKAIMLSNDKFAAANPFDYQKANRLVYCNLLEHLLLHVKIAENPNTQANENQLPGIGGAINFICKDLNDIYAGKEFTDDWRKTVAKKVKDNFDDYIAILRYLWNVIESNPIYKAIITKDMLCVGWDGKVVKEVMNALNDGE
ncbi:MAG: Eco57I restriction-modification methylase domain-containing protein [Veillonella caviae]|uniref:Eco57I restriction-modification methylase domain-containing protein n=1 Tax=Veillonella caviae TaxID=248316 RepID=UPI002A9135DD|nr:Eco57I restriction-modification methylase domain-containing protein [Veillonella caviae]MDY5481108.1 Eco57I restriction-modification methylase domain-containing protein [Veillonella caviae]